MRARKPKHIQERLAEHAAIIVDEPQRLRGAWARGADGSQRFSEVRLDLGCGKGSFIAQAAAREPDVLFVGLDNEEICIAMAAGKVAERALANVLFVIADADDLAALFAEGELAGIYLNFSTPLPKTKRASKRLTHASRLIGYRDLLAADGFVRMKTDSQPLFDFSLTQFEVAGYELDWLTRDLHAESADEVITDFEARLVEKGARIHALRAHKGPLVPDMPNDAPMGLIDYLPDDLDSLEYVPFGMEDTVFNMRNRRAKHKHDGAADDARA